ncbi:MAG: OmpA family protein [Rudaea sp.]
MMSSFLKSRGRTALRGVILVIALCASLEASAAKADLDYERLRNSLAQLRADPALGELAPAEISLAEQALAVLAEQGGKGRDHDHLVYIAERRIDIATAAAQAVEQERKLQRLDREHDQILIAASRRDAEQARLELEKQRIQSLAQAEESDRLRVEADEARAQNEQSSQQADTARKQAAQARKLADAQALEAELARKEAQLLEASGAAPTKGAKPTAPAAITLGDNAFAPGLAVLRPAAQALIARIAAAAGSELKLRIEAHADDGGSVKANLALSEQRAQAVRGALVAAGVAGKRISTAGLGAKGAHAREVKVSFAAH